MIGIVLLWFLNFGISVLNAISVGAVWTEIKTDGNWFQKLIQWCGAIMSACGFIWCYTILVGVAGRKFGFFSDAQMEGLFGLGYLLIILPVIGSGLGITSVSWMEFARRRRIRDAVAAGWNTYAQVHNMYRAIEGIPTATRSVRGLFGRDSGSSSSRSRSSNGDSGDVGKAIGGLGMVLIFAITAILGILTTWGLIAWADRKWVVQMHGAWADEAARSFEKR